VAARKKTPTKRPARKPPAGRTPQRGRALPAGAIVPDDADKEAFVRALLARGEAARRGPGGRLPAGATHEIIGTTAAGLPILRRRRFA
jgi:hypothetical protein